MPPTKKTAPAIKASAIPARAAAAKRSAPGPERPVPAAKKEAAPVKAAAVKKAATVAKKPVPIFKKAAVPAKNAVSAKAAPQVTVTLKQIAAELANGHDLSKNVAEAVLSDLVTLATQHLKKGDKIRLTGLGILQVQERAARMGRNPATGEPIEIAAGRKITFRAAKELKEAV